MHLPIPVIDLFAGPGGLGEGFSAFDAGTALPKFKIRLSVEKDEFAHKTLELRSFLRQFVPGDVPCSYYAHLRQEITRQRLFDEFPEQASAAGLEAWLAELGGTAPDQVRQRIEAALGAFEPWVLIGGPPCQAYSIAGRSRNGSKKGYKPEDDHRQYLYVEYLQIIADHRPAVFVMENVKGLLSATLREQGVFRRIVEDLQCPYDALRREGRATAARAKRERYRLYSLVTATEADNSALDDFVVFSERHGVPQARHRVIILGVREDVDRRPAKLKATESTAVRDVLNGLPRLRSGMSKCDDAAEKWVAHLRSAGERRWLSSVRSSAGEEVYDLIRYTLERLTLPKRDRGAEYVPCSVAIAAHPSWYLDTRLEGAINHSTRAHMPSDLHRYLFAACYAAVHRRSPKLKDFPKDLLPNHLNVHRALEGGNFADRFRVQLAWRPSTTVTCHVAKDGHYYIHHDPTQCRSLTVRETARLQTFPDNYLFCGPRTEQYRQVGNAVPPFLAHQIAEVVYDLLR